MSTDFDTWARDFYNPKNISSNSEGEIWGAPYFEKMMQVIQNGDDIEKFIEQKNQLLYNQYMEEKTKPYQKEIADKNDGIIKLQQSSAEIKSINNIFGEFESDIAVLMKHYPNPEQQKHVRELLSTYKYDGKFEKDWSYNQLTQKPKGFLNKLIHAKKHREAQQYLSAFIEKYENLNIPDKISKSKISNTENLKHKFDAITDCNAQNVSSWSEIIQKDLQIIDEKILKNQKDIKQNEENIQLLEKSFTKSVTIPQEDAIIRSFCDEIRNEIQHPKTLNASDYIECLDKLPDDEVVMFNIGLKSGRDIADRIKNIMEYNGLVCGDDTNQWLIRKETVGNSDQGKFEIFSPLMTVKDAKEIMPKLVADLDRAHVSSGLVIPIKASDIFREQTNDMVLPEITQERLMKLVGGAWIKQQMQSSGNPLFNHQEKMKLIGIESEQELPQVFNSLEELKTQYPKEQFLFSGTTASDDYLVLSARAGRNGTIYATPDIGYAAKYDGVTNVGSAYDGTTATGDRYVSSIIGQFSGQNVKVGFINIYQQSDDDKYFSNFGMEDYRTRIGAEELPKTYGVFEANNEGKDPFTAKLAQTDVNGCLTKDQAINGYIRRHTEIHEKDGKFYFPISYDAETYVTPEKNPLKAKIMHIEWGSNEFFIPIPENSDETISEILNKRRAKMEDTFAHNVRHDVLARIQKQKEEFKQDIVSPLRESNFIPNQQDRLKKIEFETNSLQIKSEFETKKTTAPISVGKQISLLRGTISQPKSPVKKANLDTNNVINRQATRM